MSGKFKMLGAHLADENLMITSKKPDRHSIAEWNADFRNKIRLSEDQDKLADRVLAESGRVIDETNHASILNKKEVDFRLKVRVEEIQFLIDELKKQKKVALLEEEALKVYRNRIIKALTTLTETSLKICHDCIILRENRLGVDMADDEVDRCLKAELKAVEGCTLLIDKALKETNEQLRRLKATIYLIDRDLSNKEKSLQIDKTNLMLRENQMGLSRYTGVAPLEYCVTTIDQWEHLTNENIENAAKELNSAIQLRTYIDIILKQVVEDLQNVTERTNEAFNNRIDEMRHAKKILEQNHFQTTNQANDVGRNINNLEQELANKEGYLSLSEMRAANRAQRPGMESTCDAAQDSLRKEHRILEETCAKLRLMICESKTTQRYLLHTQILQEEEINIKTNSLKIDEIDCMTIRQALRYTSF